MKPSIRTFLLINLLLSVTLIISLAIISNLLLAHRDIESRLNLELVRHAQLFEEFFETTQVQRATAKTAQVKIFTLNKTHVARIVSSKKNYLSLEKKIVFQVYGKNKELIIRSQYAPTKPLSHFKRGFSRETVSGHTWETYTAVSHHITVMTAQRADFRQYLENRLTKDSILIMLITYPFLGVLIWIIVGRGLLPLRRIRQAVEKRAASHLTPVSIESVPSEIYPIIRELNKLFCRLSQAFEREKRFAGDAAHELRTPLAALKTQAQVALRSRSDEQRNDALKKVMEGVNRSTHIVQQLLTMSRMLPDAEINQPESIELNTKILDVAHTLTPEAEKKSIKLHITTQEEALYFTGNTTSIGILIRNLLDNAIRYTPELGKITITVHPPANNSTIAFSIEDTGPGIPDDLKTRVFERFFRVIGNKSPGSGLGLGIVQQIAAAHHASVDLSDVQGTTGLKITVTFLRERA